MTDQPLQGIRVLDLTRVMTGPYCTMMLGDMGADVIKVERPGKGDDTRAWGPPFVDSESVYYLSINRNKRSIVLDLKQDNDRATLWRLIERADVIVENFSPGTVERLGFDYGAVRARRPAIVYCSISGFGQTGPGRDRNAYDLIIQGMSGLMSITGFPDGEPVRFGVPIADIAAGMFAAYAIVNALFHRERTGAGQYIDTSLFGGQIALLAYQAGIFWATGEPPVRAGNAHGIITPYQAFRTRDSHINIACGNDAIFARLCRALGLDDLLLDPRYATNAERTKHRHPLIDAIEEQLRMLDTAAVMERLTAAEVPCGPISTIDAVFDDPQVAHYGLHQRIPHTTLGEIDQTGFPYHLSDTPCTIRRPPPTLGEHTEEILRELEEADEHDRGCL